MEDLFRKDAAALFSVTLISICLNIILLSLLPIKDLESVTKQMCITVCQIVHFYPFLRKFRFQGQSSGGRNLPGKIRKGPEYRFPCGLTRSLSEWVST